EGLARLIDELVATHSAAGTLRRGDGTYVPAPEPGTSLRFPSKVVISPAGDLLVADAAQHSVAVLDSFHGVARRIGSGRRGRADGPADTAEFSEPNGLCLLPEGVAAAAGYDLIVADTVNH